MSYKILPMKAPDNEDHGSNTFKEQNRLSYRRCNVPTYRHIDGVQVIADFDCEQRYRYRLEITKCGASESPRTACVVMQNPSYANQYISDRSVTVMERIIFNRHDQHQFPEFDCVERMIVVNLFAWIQTRNFHGNPTDVGERNDDAIRAASEESTIIVVAWGANNKFTYRKRQICAMLRHLEGREFYKTSRHPSRVRYQGFIQQLCLP